MNEETEDFLKHYREKHGEVAILSKGSSLKVCMVAEGLADVYPRFAPTMEWGYGRRTVSGRSCWLFDGRKDKPFTAFVQQRGFTEPAFYCPLKRRI